MIALRKKEDLASGEEKKKKEEKAGQQRGKEESAAQQSSENGVSARTSGMRRKRFDEWKYRAYKSSSARFGFFDIRQHALVTTCLRNFLFLNILGDRSFSF